VRHGHKTGLTAVHQCCADGTWYVMLSEDEMHNTLGMSVDFVPHVFFAFSFAFSALTLLVG